MDKYLGIFCIVISLLSVIAIVVYIVLFLHSSMKTIELRRKHICLQNSLSRLDDAIHTSVTATNQIMVNHLKQSGDLSQLDREEAFEQCRCKVYGMICHEQLCQLQPYIGNVDEWIRNRIEYMVNMEKKKTL